jgi:hypothetical protein
MKLLENEYIEYIQDVAKNDRSAPPPDAVAPSMIPDGQTFNEYDELADPEELKESGELDADEIKRLFEAKSKSQIIRDFVAESPGDWSYEAFQRSSAFDTEVNNQTLKTYIQAWIKEGKLKPDADTVLPSSERQQRGGYQGGKQKAENVAYGAPEPKDPSEWSKESSALSAEFATADIRSDDGTADGTFRTIYNVVRNICLRRAQKRHCLIHGDPGVGKTYEVKKSVEANAKNSEFIYESGDIGSAPSALLAFFFYNRNGKTIILDDNDGMLVEGAQRVANILKALLDPMANEKPISVPTTMMRGINVQLEQFEPINEAVKFEIDVDRLREGVLKVDVGGREALYEHLNYDEKHRLLSIIREDEEPKMRRQKWNKYRRLSEVTHLIDDDEEELGDGEDVDAPLPDRRRRTEREEMDAMLNTDDGDQEGGITRQFYFDSSVVFVSNLRRDQINPAILDRVRAVEVNLTVDEFTDRLVKVMHGLCKNTTFNSTPQELIEWAKKCCWTGLKGVVGCWKDGAPLFGGPVVINRKLTFRAFEEFVDTFMELAYDYEERVGGGSLRDKSFRDKISKELLKQTMRRSMLPWMKEHTK